MPAVPSKFQYLFMLLKKAWEIEISKWFSTVWTTAVMLIGGLSCLAFASGNWAVFASQSDTLQRTGYGLLLIGAINLLRCITSAPYKIYCEQLSDINELKSKSPIRTIIEAFIDQDRSYREINTLSVCKVSVRQLGTIPAIRVRVKIINAIAIGDDPSGARKNYADEVKGMALQQTHVVAQPDPHIPSLAVDSDFDLAETWTDKDFIRIMHGTTFGGQVNENIGRLPCGIYELDLRAESDNADPDILKVELSRSNDGRVRLRQI
jgi:hypothetical protein